MKNVLFIAYYFPPIGGAGVQRSLKFVRYLPEHGFLPIIVTGPGVPGDRWAPADEALLEEIPSNIPIYRIQNDAPPPRGSLLGRLERWFAIPSGFSRWWINSIIKFGNKACIEKEVKLIYVSMSPFESANAAVYLSNKLRIPWVADLRDPWALDEKQIYPTYLHRRLEMSRMRSLLSNASAIIMSTPEASAVLKKSFPYFQKKVVVSITNGFDSEDFSRGVAARADTKFRIVHAGTLHTDSGFSLKRRRQLHSILGGVEKDVDILTLSHVVLMGAIEQWVRDDPSVTDKLELIFVGSVSEADKAYTEKSTAANLIHFTGFLSHIESLNFVRTADLLFLPMFNLPPGKRTTIVPGKTYEYMASGRPILAAVPDGDARDWLEQCGTAFVCRPDDVEGMLKNIRIVYKAWQNGERLRAIDRDFINQFDRKRLTQRLSAEFDKVLGSG